MSYPDWPADLPRPRRDGHAARPRDARRRIEAERSAPRFKRGSSLDGRIVSLRLDLSRSQLATFWRFYNETCFGGTSWFWMADAQSDGWPLLYHDGTPILLHDGTPLLMSKVDLVSWTENPPQETGIRGVTFSVGFDVEVLP